MALDEVLAGKAVTTPKTDVAGCLIARAIKPKETGTVTYSKDVSRILQKNCQECHRPGQVGPMPLLTYEDALAWSDTIREVVEEKRMPPWHADPKHGKFANDRSLSKEDRDTLLAWIEQGCPKGDAKDLPPERTFAKGWTIGKPDVVFTMPEAFAVPAKADSNGIRYQYFMVPTELRRRTAGCRRRRRNPGSREVVHHIIVYVGQEGPKARRRQSARRHRQRLPGRLRARRHAGGLRAGHGQEAAQGRGPRLPDALHARRRRAHGPLVGRPDLRQGAAQARGPHARHRAAALAHPAGGATTTR